MVCERPPAAWDTYSPTREGESRHRGRGSLSETTMSERFPAIRVTMLPRDTNAYGTIFGGVILSYIDLAGGIECRRQSPKKFVTKAMHEVVFVAPVYLGDLVTFYTRTVRIGTTSITVDVEVEAERLGLAGTKEIVRVTEAEVIYVAVSNDGKPVPIKS
jgi:acyl-CoA thioesterase YciA